MAKIMKLKALRRRGYSINEIVSELSIPKTTVWHHLQTVTVLPKYAPILRSRRGGSAKRAKARRVAALTWAQSLLADPATRTPLLVATGLYWGEGTKKDFGFLNTDSRLIETFLSCLAKLGVVKSRLKVGIRIYEDLDKTEAIHHWAKITQVSPERITSVEVLSGRKKGKSPYGMCRIRLAKGNDYFNLMMATIELLSKGFAPVAQRIRATDS